MKIDDGRQRQEGLLWAQIMSVNSLPLHPHKGTMRTNCAGGLRLYILNHSKIINKEEGQGKHRKSINTKFVQTANLKKKVSLDGFLQKPSLAYFLSPRKSFKTHGRSWVAILIRSLKGVLREKCINNKSISQNKISICLPMGSST